MTDTHTQARRQYRGCLEAQTYFLMKEQLTTDEVEILNKCGNSARKEVLPVVNPYWERGEFRLSWSRRIAALNIVATTTCGTRSAGWSTVGAGLVSMELSRIDGSLATFMGCTCRAGDAVDQHPRRKSRSGAGYRRWPRRRNRRVRPSEPDPGPLWSLSKPPPA